MVRLNYFKPAFLSTALIIFGFIHHANAQSWQDNIQNDSNFFSIQKAFYADPANTPAIDEEDGPIELFKRWEAFMYPRVYPTGNPIAPDIIYKEWAKYQNSRGFNKKAAYSIANGGSWYYIGPTSTPVPGGYPVSGGGTGRINCIAFRPGNPDIMWAGTGSGGLWKSTNGGLNWTTNTDNLPDLGVTDIVFNPRHPDTMYMATGDGFGYPITNGTHFDGTYSNGVMMSVNGGQTWDTTGLTWAFAKTRSISHLVIVPENPNIIFATTNGGCMRSADAGKTWTNVLNANLSDIKMNEGNHAVMYAGGTFFYMSTDTGKTWKMVNIKFPSSTGDMAIGTTPASPAVLYLSLYNNFANQGSSVYLIKSSDSGFTWKSLGAISGTNFYGYYTSALRVSPFDTNTVSAGGVDLVRSTNGGTSWNTISYNSATPTSPNYAHPDHRVFLYRPGSKDTIYDGNDGGIYMSTNGGTNWSLVSGDIHSLEFYRMGNSISDTTLLYAGAQDNGVNQFYNGNWTHVMGGDGMTCQVSSNDNSVAYGSTQNGRVKRTTDYGASWSNLYPTGSGGTNWTTPFLLDPINPDTIYFGGLKLYESIDEGGSWTNISGSGKTGIGANENVSCFAISPINDQVIYVGLGSDQLQATQPRVYRTSNGGATWVNIGKGALLPVLTYETGIDVQQDNPAIVATCFSGFVATSKVFISKDTGATWTNISAGLPNVPVDCIRFEGSEEHGIFVGTDVGIFYRNDSSNGWVLYSTGLPNTIVDQIEVFPAYHKIRACTFGRGIWDGNLPGSFSGIARINELKTEINIYPNPSTNGIFNIQLPKGSNQNPMLSVYNMIGQQMFVPQLLSGYANGGLHPLNLSNLPDGIYIVNLNYPDGVVSTKVQIMK